MAVVLAIVSLALSMLALGITLGAWLAQRGKPPF